jgi:DNA-binding winged helix-turn-helix (wHTH) protein
VQAPDGFRIKEDLIEAGWPGENQDGVSGKALSEAVRRMKKELKEVLKEKGFENAVSIKSVRGRGYRLYYPSTTPSNIEEEGEDD